MKQVLPFFLIVTLIVLSVCAVLFNVAIVYTGIFYSDTQIGLELYLSETFLRFPFAMIYGLLLISSLLLTTSVVLMWFRKIIGLYLFSALSITLMFLLLFAKPIDLYNIILILAFCLVLYLNISSFSKDSVSRE